MREGATLAMTTEKWIPDHWYTKRLVRAATRVLRSRLKAVLHYLRRCDGELDPDDVHQLRVWTRRTDAALQLFAPLVKERLLARFTRHLKQLRQAAGSLRDADVLIATLPDSASDLGDAIRQRLIGATKHRTRRLTQAKRRMELRSRMRAWRRRASQLWTRTAEVERQGTTYAEWCRSRMGEIMVDYFASARNAGADIDSLHQLRIRTKQLRYQLEVTKNAFLPAWGDELYPLLDAWQERLGLIHDAANATALFESLANDAEPSSAATLHHLATMQSARLREE